MDKLFKKSIDDRKGKFNLTLSKFQKWAFIISGVFVIMACSSAYSVYMEGKEAQVNANDSLEKFENIVLKSESSESSGAQSPQNEPSNAPEAQQPMPAVSRDSDTKVEPQVEFTPIAKLQIDEIGLNLSVLSEWSYDLLDISVNKFIGPEPNEAGNFIIIGHNYLGGAHFGKLHLLDIGDLIDLTDLSGGQITYEIYEILTIKPNETEKLTTKENRTVTLVTCTPNGELRVVIKSKEVKSTK